MVVETNSICVRCNAMNTGLSISQSINRHLFEITSFYDSSFNRFSSFDNYTEWWARDNHYCTCLHLKFLARALCHEVTKYVKRQQWGTDANKFNILS